MFAPPCATHSRRRRQFPNAGSVYLAIAWAPLIVAAIFFVIGGALIAIARFWPQRGERADATFVVVGENADLEMTGPLSRDDRVIGWPSRIDPEAGVLDIAERRRLIDGLAVVGDAWCAEILAVAYGEESEALREAVIDAIGRCGGEVVPTLERAQRSHRVVERYAAVDAASRRADVAILERGIKDTDGTVALAAAYGLARAGRRDLIDAALAGRDDSRANEIRRILPVLA